MPSGLTLILYIQIVRNTTLSRDNSFFITQYLTNKKKDTYFFFFFQILIGHYFKKWNFFILNYYYELNLLDKFIELTRVKINCNKIKKNFFFCFFALIYRN